MLLHDLKIDNMVESSRSIEPGRLRRPEAHRAFTHLHPDRIQSTYPGKSQDPGTDARREQRPKKSLSVRKEPMNVLDRTVSSEANDTLFPELHERWIETGVSINFAGQKFAGPVKCTSRSTNFAI